MSDLYFDSPATRSRTYSIIVPAGGWRRVFSQAYIKEIRPIAETLAMMSHRSSTEYESYLQEADAVYRNEVVNRTNPSWIQQHRTMQEDPVMTELWDKLQMLIALKEKENGNV